MMIRVLAIVTALALPSVALADPDKTPPADKTPDKPTDKTNEKTTDKAPLKTDKSTKLSAGDVKIIAHLHHVNQMEITLGQVAQKSGTAHVKDYAKTLVSDHQSADKDLTAFAKAHKVAAIPADKPMTDADRQDEKDMTTAMAHIKSLKGAEFDKEYLNMMVSGHDKELTKIDVSISGATDPDLKSMLQSVKPVLQRHADQARDLQKSPQASSNMPPTDKVPASK
jgi:putative membrane protein